MMRLESGVRQAIHITLHGRHNVTYTGTLIVRHDNLTDFGQPAGAGGTPIDATNSSLGMGEDYDQQGASYYVVAVVLVYGMSIVLLIASHIKRRHEKVEEDKQIDKYLQDFQIVREKHDRDNYRNLKKSIMHKINWDRGRRETIRNLHASILPLLAVGVPMVGSRSSLRRESLASTESKGRRLSLSFSRPKFKQNDVLGSNISLVSNKCRRSRSQSVSSISEEHRVHFSEPHRIVERVPEEADEDKEVTDILSSPAHNNASLIPPRERRYSLSPSLDISPRPSVEHSPVSKQGSVEIELTESTQNNSTALAEVITEDAETQPEVKVEVPPPQRIIPSFTSKRTRKISTVDSPVLNKPEMVWSHVQNHHPVSPDSGCDTPTKDFLAIPGGGQQYSRTPSPAQKRTTPPGFRHSLTSPPLTRRSLTPSPRPLKRSMTSSPPSPPPTLQSLPPSPRPHRPTSPARPTLAICRPRSPIPPPPPKPSQPTSTYIGTYLYSRDGYGKLISMPGPKSPSESSAVKVDQLPLHRNYTADDDGPEEEDYDDTRFSNEKLLQITCL